MSERSSYLAQVVWQCDETDFLDNVYSRKHRVNFDGGFQLDASSSPHVVPVPMSDVTAVDPEEMFVASLASCHMLWFLSMAVKRRFCVQSYTDEAVGLMEKNADGKMVMSVVTLYPHVVFSGTKQPTKEQIETMHHRAHDECFIANSVKTEVRCEPKF